MAVQPDSDKVQQANQPDESYDPHDDVPTSGFRTPSGGETRRPFMPTDS
jgi:hypothetical protein